MKEVEFKMPSPADLAKNDATTMISLRVKRSTADVFNMLAEKTGTKPGTMMINLLDAYAKNYVKESDNESLSTEIAKTYLNKTAEKIGKMDDSAIIRKIAQNKSLMSNIFGATDIKDEYYNAGTLEEVLDVLKKGDSPCEYYSENKTQKVTNTEEFLNGLMRIGIEDKVKHDEDCLDWTFETAFGDEKYYQLNVILARTSAELCEDIHQKGYEYRDILYMPAEKWAMTVYLLSCYEEKCENREFAFSEQLANEIVKAVNEEDDREKYVKRLAGVLIKSIEEQND